MPVDVASAASAAGTGLAIGGLPGGLVGLGVGLLTGVLGLGESPSEEAFRKMFDELYANMDWLKETAFTKDELFNTILPVVQNTFRRGADIAAAKIGATIPESISGTPQGQGFMDYFVTALAPTIAEGEQLAGQATMSFTDLWAKMDTNAKNRFLSAVQLGGNLAAGLPTTTPAQGFMTNVLQGADIGTTIEGNIAMGGALTKQAGDITGMLSDLTKGDRDATETVDNFLTTRATTKRPQAGLGG